MHNEPQTREAADFNGRRILVTGGTKGIGEAIVKRLRRGGGKVITTARSLPPGGTLDRFVQADVSTRAGIDQVVREMLVLRRLNRDCVAHDRSAGESVCT